MDPKKMMGPQGMRNLQQMFNPKMIAQLGGERRPLATSLPRAFAHIRWRPRAQACRTCRR
jgi:hypothetical protein